MKKLLLILGVTLLFVGGCSNVWNNDKASRVEEKENSTIEFDFDNKVVVGNEEAPNTLVLFMDYQCQACQTFHSKVYPKLMDKYIQTGKVKLYIYPLASISKVSYAKASLAVEFEKNYPKEFPLLIDKLYNKTVEEETNWDSRTFVRERIMKWFPNLDGEAIVNDVFNDTLKGEIDENMELAMKYNVKATPTLFVNNVRVENPLSLKAVEKFMNIK